MSVLVIMGELVLSTVPGLCQVSPQQVFWEVVVPWVVAEWTEAGGIQKKGGRDLY